MNRRRLAAGAVAAVVAAAGAVAVVADLEIISRPGSGFDGLSAAMLPGPLPTLPPGSYGPRVGPASPGAQGGNALISVSATGRGDRPSTGRGAGGASGGAGQVTDSEAATTPAGLPAGVTALDRLAADAAAAAMLSGRSPTGGEGADGISPDATDPDSSAPDDPGTGPGKPHWNKSDTAKPGWDGHKWSKPHKDKGGNGSGKGNGNGGKPKAKSGAKSHGKSGHPSG